MKIFGLVGKELSYSFSPKFFKERFQKQHFEGLYLSFEIPHEASVPGFLEWARTAVSGLNVTIPYKETVLPFLDKLSEAAQEIAAVNCIEINEEGEMIGHNTDYLGFLEPIKMLLSQGKISKALILGTGGASKAVKYALNENQVEVQLVSREMTEEAWSYGVLETHDLSDFDLIVNTTPLGMTPYLEKAPAINLSQLRSDHVVYDLIYNPELTPLLRSAKEVGALFINGKEMLKHQAELSWDVWNNKENNTL